jgi:hypothetical protein
MPIWSQVESSATGSPPSSDDPMLTPPSVSGQIYPTATASETRSNFLRAGMNFGTAYDDNVFGAGSLTPVADIAYTIRPTISLDQEKPRLHQIFTYSPGFTLYQHTSSRNEADQNASEIIEYRLTPHISVSVRDLLRKSTNVFNEPYAGVSGSTQPPTSIVVAPFADQLSNSASGEISYQFSSNSMIGGGGVSSIVNYLDPAQASGVSDSNSRGGSAFWNRRLTSTQNVGLMYQYSSMAASTQGINSETHSQTIYSFYTLYLKPSFSLSVSGGPQHFDVTESGLPLAASWAPAVTASVSWQVSRANIAASCSRTVDGAGGLLGAFKSTAASASARWQAARAWTVGATVSYGIQKNAVPALPLLTNGGHTLSGIFTVQHPIGERLTAECGYARLHQSYSGLGAISENPDSNREYISISYQFARPLGR